jgi:hypothetical protein
MAKAAFTIKKILFTSKLDLNLRNKLVNCYLLSIAFKVLNIGQFRTVDWKYLESFEMWCWIRIKKIC